MSMVDLYEIGIQFQIERDIFSDVETLEKGMGTLQEAIDKVNASLVTTADILGSIRTAAGGMAASWDAAAAAAERVNAAADRMGSGGAASAGVGEGARPNVVMLGEPEYNPGGFTMPGYRDPNLLALPGPDGTYPPTQPGQGGQSGGGHQISPWDYIIAGGAAYEVGRAAITSAYDNAAAVQHQAFLIQNQGGTSGAAQQAVNAAQSLQQQYPGLSQSQAMTIIRDAYMQTRNMPEAIGMANSLAAAAYVMQGFGDDDAAEAMFSLSRSGELRGLLNKKNPDGSVALGGFESFIDAYTKAAISTGGRVSPTDSLTILKNAGPEGLMMDQDAMTDALILSTTMGASGVGTGINALAMQFLGGKMSQGAAQNLHRAGLLPDYMFDENGKILSKYKNGLGNVLLPNGAVENEKEFQQNPFEWIEDTFEPAIAKLDPGSQTAILNSIYADLSRIPGGRLAAETIFQQGFLERQLGFLNGVPDVGSAAGKLKSDPQNVSTGVVSAFDAFMAQIGSDGMPTATAQLKDLTAALNGLTTWAKDHPHAGNDIFRGGESVFAGGIGIGLFGVYKFLHKTFFSGGKGAGPDASFADADGVEAGEGAIPLGEGFGGLGAAATGTGAVAGLLPLIVPAVVSYMMTHPDPLAVPGRYGRYGMGGPNSPPIPVTLVPGPAPMPVHVTNPHDIADGTMGALAYHGSLMPAGATGANMALTPPHPGMDWPGSFIP